jgi:hypothetical protein
MDMDASKELDNTRRKRPCRLLTEVAITDDFHRAVDNDFTMKLKWKVKAAVILDEIYSF